MIPEGNYLARGMSLTDGKSKDKGTPGMTVVFGITQEGPQKGQMMEWTGYLTEKSQARTAESLVLCGFDGTDYETIKKNEVLLVVVHEDQLPDPNNPNAPPRKRAKIAWINDPNRGGMGMVPLDGSEREQVMANLRGLIFAKREEMVKKAAAAGDGTSFNFGANAPAPNGAPTGGVPPTAGPQPVTRPKPMF
jgi:hypothetical protein